jgi:hypothetical protein
MTSPWSWPIKTNASLDVDVDAIAIDTDKIDCKYNRDFVCPLCLRISLNPYNPRCCGQISCRGCLLAAIEKLRNICPFCKNMCSSEDIIPSPYTRMQVSKLKAHCINQKCKETMILGDLMKHLSECKYAFCEFQISKWSEIKTSTEMYSLDTALKAFGIVWWLKVVKNGDKIGLYLCCGKVGAITKVKYQLMTKIRNSTKVAKSSIFFDTEFGKEYAWGLSNFTNTAELEQHGAYSRVEDVITFGCQFSMDAV